MTTSIDGSASATFATPLPVAQGGTGAATAAAGRISLDASVPCFRAYNSVATSITASIVKVGLQTKDFDTTNAFDAATNYRFQPTVAGYYQINGSVQFATASYTTHALIYKNGVVASNGTWNTTSAVSVVSDVLYLNGSTDYVELFAYSSTTQNTATGSGVTYMSGSLVRAA